MIRFIMVGGFLGAGKTTTVARLAAMYQAQGRRVAIVTNDKAPELVDTFNLIAQGFPVAEMAGACFCGNAQQLLDAVAALPLAEAPEVVIAEPVGSCLDLVATLLRPLAQQFSTQVSVAPYGVLVKPSHGQKILRGSPLAGFSPKAAYIFHQQLAEADFLAINRSDQLSVAELDELTQLLHERHPQAKVLPISARTGAGFAALVDQYASVESVGTRRVDIDYEMYLGGEAELGWLNGAWLITAAQMFDLDEWLLALVQRLAERLQAAQIETAHLKARLSDAGQQAVANLVSSDTPAELSRSANHHRALSAQLTINARVACAPELLRQLIEETLAAHHRQSQTLGELQHVQSFRPGQEGGVAPFTQTGFG